MLRIRIAGLCILCSLRVRDGNASILLLLHLTTYLVSPTNPRAPLYRVNDGTLYCTISFSPPFLIATIEYIVPSIASLFGSRSKYIQVHSHSSSHSNSEHKQIMCSCVDYRTFPLLDGICWWVCVFIRTAPSVRYVTIQSNNYLWLNLVHEFLVLLSKLELRVGSWSQIKAIHISCLIYTLRAYNNQNYWKMGTGILLFWLGGLAAYIAREGFWHRVHWRKSNKGARCEFACATAGALSRMERKSSIKPNSIKVTI